MDGIFHVKKMAAAAIADMRNGETAIGRNERRDRSIGRRDTCLHERRSGVVGQRAPSCGVIDGVGDSIPEEASATGLFN
jgi:hypothetical protein